MISRLLRQIAVTALVLLATAAAAGAQGQSSNHRPVRPQRNPRTSARAGTAGRTELPLVVGRTLAGWLDDAETLEPGTVSLGISVGRWKSLDGVETDGPVVDAAVGIADRAQLSASVPYYRASYADGFQAKGLGDTYITGKVRLLDPSEHPIGVAISPMLEILSDAAVADATLGLSRTNWALPLSVQAGTGTTRGYGTFGYFSRGAIFAGAAIEHVVASHVTLAASLVHSYSTRRDANSDLLGLSRSRTDAVGAVYLTLAPHVTLSAGAGRTISAMDQNGARFTGSVGLSVVVPRTRSRP